MVETLRDPALWHRLQFAFTITYHYLFPQLTMGLAWFLVYWKWKALRTGEERYRRAARFWARIFGLNFALGVVTGLPMEFQFGTNWAGFSRYAGGVVGQTLAMEGMFAFFLESAFIGALIWGEKRLGPRAHFGAAVAVAIGSWLSGYFILVTNAFMQRPVGYAIGPDGTLTLADLGAYLGNGWAWIQFSHNQTAAVVTGSFVIAAVGAFYSLRGVHAEQAKLYLRAGTLVGLIASLVVAFPTGNQQAKLVGRYQPVTLAAMEGRFEGGAHADVAMIGQPNLEEQKLENPIVLPGGLSFLAYGTFGSYVRGLNEFPRDTWPDNIELLYYSFHLMIALGTTFIAIMAWASWERWRGRLETSHALRWVLLLSFPFPYIATSLGWMTSELGRQPWLIYGLLRTADGYSKVVGNGDVLFTLIGFVGLYIFLGLLFLYLVGREVFHGPGPGEVGAGMQAHAMILAVWYGVVAFMLATYVVLDGRNFGVGVAHWIVARERHERRQVIAALGPLWLWHEVWLIGVGGVLFVAFPRLLASAFSGYYLAMFLILWCAILRGVSLEVGGHLDDRLWQSFWDAVFFVSSALLAILFGAALGNLIRGVPLHPDGTFHMAFFTDFRTVGNVGLLDWYTVSVALFGALALTAHGVTYLAQKTEGPVHDRAARLARRLWLVAAPGFAVVSYMTLQVRPELFTGLLTRPIAWVAEAIALASAAALAHGLYRGQGRRAFLGSTLLLQGILGATAAALYPVMLPSTLDPADHLTAARVAAPEAGLITASIWWPVAAGLACGYFFFVRRYYLGKVGPTRDPEELY